jgi:hypothetical protein
MRLSKPVLINGVYYNSCNKAASIFCVDERTIINRCNSPNFNGYIFTTYQPPKEKICSTCKTKKPLDDFKKAKVNRDGHSSWCKKCWSIYVIINQNKIKKNANNKKWGASEKGRITRKLAKEIRRANETNSKIILTQEERKYIKWLHEKTRIMRSVGFDVHLDHIIPISKGGLHVPMNLQIIPAEDNLRKNNRLHFEIIPN